MLKHPHESKWQYVKFIDIFTTEMWTMWDNDYVYYNIYNVCIFYNIIVASKCTKF